MAEYNRILDELTANYPALIPCAGDIRAAFELIAGCFEGGGKLLVCGNGGSAADSGHIAGELMKGFKLSRKLGGGETALFEKIPQGAQLAAMLQNALPAVALDAHTALITAVMNDTSADAVFAQQGWAYAKNSPDTLLALSTTGSSANIVNAAKTAFALGRKVISVTGALSSELEKFSDVCVKIPETETYRVQELTLPVYHALCAMAEEYFFGSDMGE